MDLIELQDYLYEKIPQVKSMEVEVNDVTSDSLTVSAPLEPNINHRDSVFGGSASSISILSAWAFVHQKLASEGISTTLVIQKNTMTYDIPITGKFSATAKLSNGNDWEKFVKMLKRKGKSRINVCSNLNYADKNAGQFEGTFVAVGCKSA
ncbi:MAG: YiiD C-terminal domain-containing protein [Alteromonadaceae bacterium]|nr:YiiD C-terminal domain-containing protein [Alteromonadaceae bacterium]